jgi:curved DNA-binding protein CbpA
MSQNYYVILGIPADSSLSDIKSAFRRLAKEFHPDHFGTSNSPFPAIQEAYSVLSDPKQRKQYDESLKTERLHGIKKHRVKTYQSIHDNDVEPLIPEDNEAEPLTGFSGSSGTARQSSGPGYYSLFNRFFNTVPENRNYDRKQRKSREIVIIIPGIDRRFS